MKRALAAAATALFVLPLSLVATPAEAVTVPSAPRFVKSEKTATTAKVTWTYPSNNGGSDITNYRLSRAGYVKYVSSTTRSFTFTGLKPLTSYNLYVQAANSAGLGASLKVVVTTNSPPYKGYPNCTELNKVYIHGVGKVGAQDQTSGTPVTNFFVSSYLYSMNDSRDVGKGQYDLDRDNDGIACEKI